MKNIPKKYHSAVRKLIKKAVINEKNRMITGFFEIRNGLTGEKPCLTKQESELVKFLDQCIEMIRKDK